MYGKPHAQREGGGSMRDQDFFISLFLSSFRSNSLTKSAMEVYSVCFSRKRLTCSYKGSGIAICRYPLVMLKAWYKFISKCMKNSFTTNSKYIYKEPCVFTTYGKRRGSNESL